jgi:glycosyltransferase involved in cell wall biosynthesis
MGTIWHLFHATRKAAGAYVDALQKASHAGNIKSYAFTSRNYIYDTKGVIKYFLPFTDFTEKRNKLILLIRGFELITGYFFIWLAALVLRPVICIHLAGFSGGTNILFRMCKLARLRVYLTCHDVTELNEEMDNRRLYMLKNADKLIVHSSAAQNMLHKYLGDDVADRISKYPFPFSSYDSILVPQKTEQAAKTLRELLGDEDAEYFLFIGGVRKSKGPDVLVDAWKMANCKEDKKLLFAGKWVDDGSAELMEEAVKIKNCYALNRYLSNEEFAYFIEKSKFIILPYSACSHSSVLISCAKQNGAVIISDIEYFKDFLSDYDLTFPRNDEKALAAMLDMAAKMPYEQIKEKTEILKKAVERSDRKLIQEVIQAYKDI